MFAFAPMLYTIDIMYQPAYVYIAPNFDEVTLPEHCYQDNIDVAILHHDAMTIEQARRFVEIARERPMERPKRTIVLAANQLSEAVQNTLLKILEEPPATTEIYIVIPRVGMLLPTVRSRVQVVDSANTQTTFTNTTKTFLNSHPTDRIQQIAAWHKQKDSHTPKQVVQEIARAMANRSLPESLQTREAIALIESYIQFPGASWKMLVEELALSLPAGIVLQQDVNQML